MQPTDRIIHQPWLAEAGATAVVAALTAGSATVRFVGGCVRDALLDRPVRDIDIAIDAPPETVIALLEAADLKAVPTGLDHGTVTAVAHGHPFEVTTLRRDVETFGRHATVAFTDDWLEDAKRRDFTINALYCDPDGTVYDPTGGLSDLDVGRVRFVGDATQRIEEDALRILRFFRFYAWFGHGDPDPEAMAACAARKSDMDRLSVERIRHEILRLLEAPDPMPALRAMASMALLDHILPEATHLDCLERLIEFGGTDPLLRLAALTDRRPGVLTGLAMRWKLSNADARRLRGMTAGEVTLPTADDGPALRAQIYWLGGERLCDLAMLDSAHDGADRTALARVAGDWEAPSFPVKGADVLALGVAPGEKVGRLLSVLERDWVAEDFAADRKMLLSRLRAMVETD